VRGAKSDVLGAATFARMAEELPGLAQISVPGVGHVPDLAQADTLEAIHALLARA
jgi:pimeloyl-ACP methyl ester carboxylesterase